VEVAADRLAEGRDPLEQGLCLCRRGNADRVGENELVRVGRRQPLGDLDHPVGCDRPFERTAEGDRDRQAGADPVLSRTGHDLLGGRDAVFHRRARVPLREAFGRREREADLVQGSLAQAVVPALVQRQAGVGDAVAAVEPGHNLLGAGHLRHALGIDEARGLDPLQARVCEPADELCARLGRDDLLLVLEPVARTDLPDQLVEP
jgi:hypothetical protein